MISPTANSGASFAEAYERLNEEQKKAVDHTEGPVMVVAGPGTGKTQILALRIGKILLHTDTQPHNILCLTYTDAGAIAMRKRLLQFIGPDAYKVQVHTFHSFCNQVIQDHQDAFSALVTLMHVSDLEKAQMYRELIDQLEVGNPLRRLKGQHYFEAKRLDNLYATMKKEFWSPEKIITIAEKEVERIENDTTNKKYFYQRRSKGKVPGDKKKGYFDRISNLEKLIAAARLFDTFQSKMREGGRYDFDDMIHWVVNAFRTNELLLSSYQERFLYFLVDEYQDTNGSQNEIIKLLVNYWDQPNLFVVGDEDQAIFRFQGANITNIRDLYEKYRPKVIVLQNNYRSTQPILNAAMSLISCNPDRLTDDIPGVEKHLKAQSGETILPPKVREYINVAQEEAGVFTALLDLHQRGEALHSIAVIYRKHALATNLIKALSHRDIPIDVKHRVNILHDPLIHNLEQILTFLQLESESPGRQDQLLFKIMHYRFFDIEPIDLARISQHLWQDRTHASHLRMIIRDRQLLESLKLQRASTIMLFAELVDKWIQLIPHVTVQTLFERILKGGNVFSDIVVNDLRTYRMQVVATFFNHLKEECRRNPQLDLRTLLETLSQMREIEIPIPMQSIARSKDGINFLTAHGAKGLEFKHVFVLGCNKRNWNSRYRNYTNSYALPEALQDPGDNATEDDERRLFYVAATRAKSSLNMSYAAENLNGMPAERTNFINEMAAHAALDFEEVEGLPEDTLSMYRDLIDIKEQNLPLLDHELIDQKLEKFSLSPSSLNKYLECPRSFYFEYILRVPRATNQHLGYGNAVHKSLDNFLTMYKKGLKPGSEYILELYEKAMKQNQSFFTSKQYENYMAHGKIMLPKYVESKLPQWSAASELLIEEAVRTTHKEVPINGRFDLMLKNSQGHVTVIDFKTGSPDAGHVKGKLAIAKNHDETGGDYWRQVIFYQILLDASELKNPMEKGVISFVDQDKYHQLQEHAFMVNIGEVDHVSKQIVDTYQRMKNHEFDVDCGRDQCTWCSFIRNDFVLLPESVVGEPPDMDEEYDLGSEAMQLHFDF